MSFSSLSQLTANERAAIKEYIRHISNRFPGRILSVSLFGSKARGDDDAESDIDLLVLVNEEDATFRSQLWAIASDVSLDHALVLSVRVLGEARWAENRRMGLPLYRAIESEAVLLSPSSWDS
jgi:uncharacterized protein